MENWDITVFVLLTQCQYYYNLHVKKIRDSLKSDLISVSSILGHASQVLRPRHVCEKFKRKSILVVWIFTEISYYFLPQGFPGTKNTNGLECMGQCWKLAVAVSWWIVCDMIQARQILHLLRWKEMRKSCCRRLTFLIFCTRSNDENKKR